MIYAIDEKFNSFNLITPIWTVQRTLSRLITYGQTEANAEYSVRIGINHGLHSVL